MNETKVGIYYNINSDIIIHKLYKILVNDLVNEDDFICQDTLGDLVLKARALYDYQAGKFKNCINMYENYYL